MANRNELHIHQSGDPMGVTFNVYRSDTPDVSDSSRLVAVVNEANALHTAYQEIGEELTQDSIDPFVWYTKKIYEEAPGFTIYVNGSQISPIYIQSQPNSKAFRFTDKYDMTNNKVTADYWYLASVLQDDTRDQAGVQYQGPVALAINAPINFAMAYDFTSYKMNITWLLDTTPKTFYYAIKAFDRNGFISPLSDEQHISLAIDPSTTTYIVEKAVKIEGPWFVGTTVSTTEWDDPDAAIGGHIPMEFHGVNNGGAGAALTFSNPWHNWQSNWRPSYFYRVYCVDDEGQRGPSAPEVPFYKGINIKPVKYVLRRKRDNGTPATLDGVDAITIKTWTEADVNVNDDSLSYTDSALLPAIYSYTTYVIDEKGMVGQPFYTTVDMR